MGPGIFTKYSKQVIGGLLVLLAVVVGIIFYYQLRSNVGGVSPYEEVNALRFQEKFTMSIEEEVFNDAGSLQSVAVKLRNDAEDGILIYGEPHHNDWELELWHNNAWHVLRPEKAGNITSDYSGGVGWGGEEQIYRCNIAHYYRTPLKAGTYRIVFPNMIHADWGSSALAVEFEVQ